MPGDPIDFAAIIEQDRTERQKLDWQGTFLQYLELVKQRPQLADLAHRRMYDMMSGPGVSELDLEADPRAKRVFGDETVKIYNFFADEFFGMERTLEKIVRYFHSAAMGGEEARQVLYLMGPVGSGKSSLVERLKRGLEDLRAPARHRGLPDFRAAAAPDPAPSAQGVRGHAGGPDRGRPLPGLPLAAHERSRREVRELPDQDDFVQQARPARHRRGAAGRPQQPGHLGPDRLGGHQQARPLQRGRPAVLELNGAFNVGNRGMVEFIEVFKNETEYLHTMITATQEKFVPAPGRHGTIYVDTCIVAHSNEAEWQKFKADHTNEAILDRIVVVKVPYNLRLSEEVKIYRKFLDRSKFNAQIAPHTLEVASMFAILSRLDPSPKCDLMTKLKIYNGEEVLEKGRPKKLTVHELREDAKREGLFGISTRFIMKALDTALTRNNGSIHPINVREALIGMVKEADTADDTKKQYLEFLQDALHKVYLEMLEKDITKAFVYSFQGQAETLFHNYLDHAEAYVTKTKVKDPVTRDEMQPDDAFLKSIEEQIAIIGPAADGFRQEVIAYLWAATRRGEKIDYASYEPLKEAIEKKLMNSVRDISRIITKARTRDDEQRQKYDAMVENLIGQGYNEDSIDTILKYASNHLWKD